MTTHILFKKNVRWHDDKYNLPSETIHDNIYFAYTNVRRHDKNYKFTGTTNNDYTYFV